MCTKPLIRAETNEAYKNKKGGTSYRVEWLQRDQYDRREKNKLLMQARYRRIQEIPCGQCVECRLNYSRQWATRAMLEKKYWPENQCWFLTLTYSDEYLPINSAVDTETGEIVTGASLQKKDMQDFWKRVREHWNLYNKTDKEGNIEKYGLKYLNAGEYGHENYRPHYHALVYGLPLNPMKIKKIGNNDQGDAYFESFELDELWGKGFVTVGQMTWQSAAYVARYTLKKAYGGNNDILLAMGKKPEFVSMSQGFAKRYFDEHKELIYHSDTVPVLNTKTGEFVKPPKNFDRMLKEIDSEIYYKVKRAREKQKNQGEREARKQTDLTPEERRSQKEELIKKSFKDIRKEL